jgi:hypothetical protein
VDSLFTGLLMAGVTGLTWFAYKHPDGYRYVGTPLAISLILLGASVLMWQLGVHAARDALLPFVPVTSRADASAAVSSLEVRHAADFLLGDALAALYLTLLRALPLLVKNDH